MPLQTLNQLKQWFQTGDKPTQQQFYDFMDSFFHKDDDIAMADVTNLVNTLNAKLDITQFDLFEQGELIAHNTDALFQIPAGYLLEKVLCKLGAPGNIKMSHIGFGLEDALNEIPVDAGWNKPIELNIVAEAALDLYISGVPNNSKLLFIKRKLKMI